MIQSSIDDFIWIHVAIPHNIVKTLVQVQQISLFLDNLAIIIALVLAWNGMSILPKAKFYRFSEYKHLADIL